MLDQEAIRKYEDKGVVFKRETDGQLVIIQATLLPDALRTQFPYVAVFTLTYRPGNNGLPDMNDLNRIRKIEGQLAERLRAGGAILMGHALGLNMMQVVLYGSASLEAPVVLKTGLLSKETFTPDARHDPQWSVFAHLLEPTEAETQFTRNKQLLEFLKEQGDLANIARSVDFTMIFTSAEDRAEFILEATAEGFVLADIQPEGFWCDINKVTTLEPETIGKHTAYLERVAARHGGELDGWACHVTTE